jgi:hypothetical protein
MDVHESELQSLAYCARESLAAREDSRPTALRSLPRLAQLKSKLVA